MSEKLEVTKSTKVMNMIMIVIAVIVVLFGIVSFMDTPPEESTVVEETMEVEQEVSPF